MNELKKLKNNFSDIEYDQFYDKFAIDTKNGLYGTILQTWEDGSGEVFNFDLSSLVDFKKKVLELCKKYQVTVPEIKIKLLVGERYG